MPIFHKFNKMRFWIAGVSCLVWALMTSGCFFGAREESETHPPVIQPKSLVVLNWPEYLAPEVYERFEAETGIKVVERNFENLGENRNLLQTVPEELDIVVADGLTIAELIELKLIQPLDKRRLQCFAGIDRTYLGPPFDPGNLYSVPYVTGATIVAYRKDHLPEPSKSWQILYDKRFRGKVAMLDEREDLYAVGLRAIGASANSNHLADIERCTERLLKQVDDVAPRFGNLEQIKEWLKSGSVTVAMAYSVDASLISQSVPEVGYFIPEEGAPIWFDSFVVSREAKNVEGAHKFIDFISRPEIAALNAREIRAATPVVKAKPLLDDALRLDQALYPPPETLAKCEFCSKSSPLRLRATNEGMKRILDRSRGETNQNMALEPKGP